MKHLSNLLDFDKYVANEKYSYTPYRKGSKEYQLIYDEIQEDIKKVTDGINHLIDNDLSDYYGGYRITERKDHPVFVLIISCIYTGTESLLDSEKWYDEINPNVLKTDATKIIEKIKNTYIDIYKDLMKEAIEQHSSEYNEYYEMAEEDNMEWIFDKTPDWIKRGTDTGLLNVTNEAYSYRPYRKGSKEYNLIYKQIQEDIAKLQSGLLVNNSIYHPMLALIVTCDNKRHGFHHIATDEEWTDEIGLVYHDEFNKVGEKIYNTFKEIYKELMKEALETSDEAVIDYDNYYGIAEDRKIPWIFDKTPDWVKRGKSIGLLNTLKESVDAKSKYHEGQKVRCIKGLRNVFTKDEIYEIDSIGEHVIIIGDDKMPSYFKFGSAFSNFFDYFDAPVYLNRSNDILWTTLKEDKGIGLLNATLKESVIDDWDINEEFRKDFENCANLTPKYGRFIGLAMYLGASYVLNADDVSMHFFALRSEQLEVSGVGQFYRKRKKTVIMKEGIDYNKELIDEISKVVTEIFVEEIDKEPSVYQPDLYDSLFNSLKKGVLLEVGYSVAKGTIIHPLKVVLPNWITRSNDVGLMNTLKEAYLNDVDSIEKETINVVVDFLRSKGYNVESMWSSDIDEDEHWFELSIFKVNVGGMDRDELIKAIEKEFDLGIKFIKWEGQYITNNSLGSAARYRFTMPKYKIRSKDILWATLKESQNRSRNSQGKYPIDSKEYELILQKTNEKLEEFKKRRYGTESIPADHDKVSLLLDFVANYHSHVGNTQDLFTDQVFNDLNTVSWPEYKQININLTYGSGDIENVIRVVKCKINNTFEDILQDKMAVLMEEQSDKYTDALKTAENLAIDWVFDKVHNWVKRGTDIGLLGVKRFESTENPDLRKLSNKVRCIKETDGFTVGEIYNITHIYGDPQRAIEEFGIEDYTPIECISYVEITSNSTVGFQIDNGKMTDGILYSFGVNTNSHYNFVTGGGVLRNLFDYFDMPDWLNRSKDILWDVKKFEDFKVEYYPQSNIKINQIFNAFLKYFEENKSYVASNEPEEFDDDIKLFYFIDPDPDVDSPRESSEYGKWYIKNYDRNDRNTFNIVEDKLYKYVIDNMVNKIKEEPSLYTKLSDQRGNIKQNFSEGFADILINFLNKVLAACPDYLRRSNDILWMKTNELKVKRFNE